MKAKFIRWLRYEHFPEVLFFIAMAAFVFGILIHAEERQKHSCKRAFVTGVLCGVNATHDIYLENNPRNDNIDEVFRRVYAMPGLPEDYKP